MDWFSFTLGAIGGGMFIAVFRDGEESELGEMEDSELDGGVPISEGESVRSRLVVLSCQTCRKLKKHREVEPGLFQCVRCKRHTDTR